MKPSENTQRPIESPRIPDRSFNILAYGAQGDGLFLNTQAIQAAIDDAHGRDGGVVIIPQGTFRSGSLVLKSGVENACIVRPVRALSGRTKPKLPPKPYGGHVCQNCGARVGSAPMLC